MAEEPPGRPATPILCSRLAGQGYIKKAIMYIVAIIAIILLISIIRIILIIQLMIISHFPLFFPRKKRPLDTDAAPAGETDARCEPENEGETV